MPRQVGLIVRLPSGTEHWYASEVPEKGAVLSHMGTEYIVVSVESTEDERLLVTLAEVPADLQPAEVTLG